MPFDPCQTIEAKLVDLLGDEDGLENVSIRGFGDNSAELEASQIVVHVEKLERLEPNDDMWKCQASISAIVEMASDEDSSNVNTLYAAVMGFVADLEPSDFSSIDYAGVDGVVFAGDADDIQDLADGNAFRIKASKCDIYFQRAITPATT